MRIAFTDGEMTNLAADGFGQLLCAVVGEYSAPQKPGQRPWKNIQVFTLDDYRRRRWDDKGLAKRWRDCLEQYDIITTWNGLTFDFKFLETRLAEHGLRGARFALHKDLLYTARYKLRLSSNSLQNVSEFYRIEDRYKIAKTHLDKKRWRMAIGGHEPSYQYIVHHCVNDVKVLGALWHEMKGLITEIKRG